MKDLGAYLARFAQGTLQERLDALAELRDQQSRQVLDLQAQIATLEAQIAERTLTLTSVIAALEETIKRECLRHKRSAKGARLQVVYSKGRITWDTRGLEGYALSHREILRFRKQGEPSAKIVEHQEQEKA